MNQQTDTITDALSHDKTAQYLQRLQLRFEKPELDFIRALQQQHIATFSFNSLAVILGQEPEINTDAVFHKIVQQQQGGYCFEHNKLIFDVLRCLGFDVSLQLARVVKKDNQDAPRTHRFTLVSLNEKHYIVDGGYGPTAPILPVELTLDIVQRQGDEQYRVIQATNGDYLLQRLHKNAFTPLYRFDLGRYTEADCLTGHFYSYKHPAAVFVNNLVASRKEPQHTWSLRNHQLYDITTQETQVTTISTPELLQQLLSEHFQIQLDLAVCSFLFDRFIQSRLIQPQLMQE